MLWAVVGFIPVFRVLGLWFFQQSPLLPLSPLILSPSSCFFSFPSLLLSSWSFCFPPWTSTSALNLIVGLGLQFYKKAKLYRVWKAPSCYLITKAQIGNCFDYQQVQQKPVAKSTIYIQSINSIHIILYRIVNSQCFLGELTYLSVT